MSKLSYDRVRFGSAIVAVAAALLMSGCATGGNVSFSGPTEPADSFVDGLGVNGHFTAFYTPNTYDLNFGALNDLLKSSAIRHLRNPVNINADENGLLELKTLADEHITYSVIINPGLDPDEKIRALPSVVGRRSLQFVEGPNELDISGNPKWQATMAQDVGAVYVLAREESGWSGISLLAPSFGYARNAALIGNRERLFDAGNIHYGPHHGSNPDDAQLAEQLRLERSFSGDKPIWVTETGYETDGGPCTGRSTATIVPDDIIAKYDPRLYAQWWRLGVRHVFFYQLSDMSENDGQFGCSGLVDDFGQPKPQFLTLSAMLQLLADPGAPYDPVITNWTLDGETRGVRSVTLSKRDGSVWLLVWLEKRAWIPWVNLRLSVPAQHVRLTLQDPRRAVTAYTYGPDWKLHSSVLAPQDGSWPFDVTDSISFIEIKPTSSAARARASETPGR